MFLVYILKNPSGRFYIGHTDNLEKRVASHNRTDTIRGKFTRKNGPWALIRSEEHLIAQAPCAENVKSNRGNQRT
jgi:predicted GIY-YIG superfamily endonuclease